MGLSLGDIDKRTGGDQKMVKRARISLGEIDKASQATGVDLTHGLLECGLEVDSSGSLEHAYSDGSVQETGERVLAWVAPVDNSGAAEVGFFDSTAHDPNTLDLGNYRGWVRANRPRYLGATNLYEAIVMGAKMASKALNAPEILDLIMTEVPGSSRGLLGRRSGPEQRVGLDDSGNSHYVLPLDQLRPVKTSRLYHLTIITDGGPNRGPRPYRETIKELIVRLSYAGIFIKFIYIGDDPEGQDFLQLLDDMPVAKHQNDLADPTDRNDPRRNDVDYYPGARYIDNVDKVEFLRGLRHVSDEEFAQAMTQELPTYVPSAVRRSLVTTENLVAA
jgi:hypothetical protein